MAKKNGSFIMLDKKIIDLIGFDASLILAVFIDANNLFADKNGWFYQTHEKLTEITSLKRVRQTKALNKLKELKILKQKNMGLPCKRHFKLNVKRIYELAGSSSIKKLLNKNFSNVDDEIIDDLDENIDQNIDENSDEKSNNFDENNCDDICCESSKNESKSMSKKYKVVSIKNDELFYEKDMFSFTKTANIYKDYNYIDNNYKNSNYIFREIRENAKRMMNEEKNSNLKKLKEYEDHEKDLQKAILQNNGVYYQELSSILSGYNINIMSVKRMGKSLNRVKEVVKFAKNNNKADGWIYMALRDDFDLSKSQKKIDEFEKIKRAGSLETFRIDEEKIKKQDEILKQYNLL